MNKIWISHPESECIFIGTYADLEQDGLCCELGEVVEGNLEEIVLILKRLGWSPREIMSTNIYVEK